jgi:hypothetical protein
MDIVFVATRLNFENFESLLLLVFPSLLSSSFQPPFQKRSLKPFWRHDHYWTFYERKPILNRRRFSCLQQYDNPPMVSRDT